MQKTRRQPLAVRLRAHLRAALGKRPKPPSVPDGHAEVPDGLRADVGLLPRYRVNRPQAPPPMDPLRFM